MIFENWARPEILARARADSTEPEKSDKLLAAVDRPDFRGRLLDELILQGSPPDKAGE